MAGLASEHVLARGCPVPANSLRPRTGPPAGGGCYASPQRYLRTAFTHRYPRLVLVRAGSPGDETPATEEKPLKQNTEFGYSRKDVILIGVGLIALGYALYYGVQALGVEPGMAGNFVQLAVFLGIFIGYIGTYFYRVATKKMTYVQQLEDYEAAVMEKRLQEMTEGEVERMMEEVEQRKGKRGERP